MTDEVVLRNRLTRRFSERQLRRVVETELPELASELPGTGASAKDVAFVLVQVAKHRGYLDDVEALLVPRERRARALQVALVGMTMLGCAGAALAMGMGMQGQTEGRDSVVAAQEPEVASVLEPSPNPSEVPEAGPAAAPEPANRPPRARRRELAAIAPPPAPVTASPAGSDGSDEPQAGSAVCQGRSCRLRADSGEFHRSEAFCVEPGDDSGVQRCILHGTLIHPAPSVTCDLSEARLTGELRWRRCHAKL